MSNLPSDEARPKKIHQRKSTRGSIPKKASHIRSNITRGGLQSDITLRVHKRNYKSSPSLTLSLSLRNHRGIQALSVRKKKEERQ